MKLSESFKCTWGPLNDRNLDAMSVEEIKEMLIELANYLKLKTKKRGVNNG